MDIVFCLLTEFPFLKFNFKVLYVFSRITKSQIINCKILYFVPVLYLSTDLIPMMGSDSTDGVVAAYEHALFSALPKRRYPVGRDSFVFMISSYLPSWLMDALFNLPLFRNIPAAMKNR